MSSTQRKEPSCIRNFLTCGIPLPWAAKFVAVIGMLSFGFMVFASMRVYFDYERQEDGKIIMDSRKELEFTGEGGVQLQVVNTTVYSENVMIVMVFSSLMLLLYIALYTGIIRKDYDLVSLTCGLITFVQLTITVLRGLTVLDVIYAEPNPIPQPGILESIVIFFIFPYSVWILQCYKKKELLKPKVVPSGEKGKVEVNEV